MTLGLVDHPEPRTDEVDRLTGRPAFPYEAWARDHAAAFRRCAPETSHNPHRPRS